MDRARFYALCVIPYLAAQLWAVIDDLAVFDGIGRSGGGRVGHSPLWEPALGRMVVIGSGSHHFRAMVAISHAMEYGGGCFGKLGGDGDRSNIRCK